MEKGKNGVVFFSFGSNTNTNQMPEKFKQNLFTAFSKLRDYHFIIKIDKGDTVRGHHRKCEVHLWTSKKLLIVLPLTDFCLLTTLISVLRGSGSEHLQRIHHKLGTADGSPRASANEGFHHARRVQQSPGDGSSWSADHCDAVLRGSIPQCSSRRTQRMGNIVRKDETVAWA